MEKIIQEEINKIMAEELKRMKEGFKNPPLTVDGDIEIDKIEYE